jgi:mRNA interferase MazF|nr:MAG TPA: PemK-like protein [Caudoviricetes sp.]
MTEYYRGDIFHITPFYTVTGSEQRAGRPGVIVSNDANNKYSPNVEIVFLTSQKKKPLPTHVPVMCRVPSTALCENIQTVSKDRLSTFIKSCTTKELKNIDNALLVSLGISDSSPVGGD